MSDNKGLLFRNDNTTVSQPQCFVPSNLHNFKLGEQIFSGSTIGIGVLGTLALPITPWIIIMWGAKMGTDAGNLVQFDGKIKEFANQLEWKKSVKKTNLSVSIQTSVLKSNQGFDISFKIKSGITPPFYNESHIDSWDPVLSNYQDQIGFSIQPVDLNNVKTDEYLSLNTSGTAPETLNKKVDYTVSKNWHVDGGFEGGASNKDAKGGVNFKVGHSITQGSKVGISDFEVLRESDKNTVAWLIQMRNLYEEADRPKPYNIKNPSDLVVNGAATKWLKDVPDMAKSEINPEFLASYINGSYKTPLQGNEKLYFKFKNSQFLKHLEIVGRWGARTARLGGILMYVPSIAVQEGILEVDLNTQKTNIIKVESTFWSFRNMVNKDIQPLL